MNEVLVTIPPRFFPSYKVIHPFKARVQYEEFDTNKVGVLTIAFTPDALRRLGNVAGLADHIEQEVTEAVLDAKAERIEKSNNSGSNKIDYTVKYCPHCRTEHIIYACDKTVAYLKRKFQLK